MKYFAQGHSSSGWQSQDSNSRPAVFDSVPCTKSWGERPNEQCEKTDIDPDLRQLAVGQEDWIRDK